MANWIIEYCFDRYQWYRRMVGGHWELWILDFPVCGEMWHQVQDCHLVSGTRPPLARGTPVCESWEE